MVESILTRMAQAPVDYNEIVASSFPVKNEIGQ